MGWSDFLFLQETMMPGACLVMPGLKNIFHLQAHSNNFLKSLYHKFLDSEKSYTVQN